MTTLIVHDRVMFLVFCRLSVLIQDKQLDSLSQREFFLQMEKTENFIFILSSVLEHLVTGWDFDSVTLSLLLL